MNETAFEIILDLVKLERERQDVKWGADRKLSDMEWLTIIVEEVGEAAQDILKGNSTLSDEIIQIIAVGFAWLECKKNYVIHPYKGDAK